LEAKLSVPGDFTHVPQTEQDWMYLEMEIRTLFSAGPIDEEQLFAGRISQIKQLFEATLERSRHAVLFGERGVGKTSLANVFWRRFSKRLQSIVAARAQADPSDDFTALWSKALRELRAAALSAGKGDLIPISDSFDTLSPDDVRIELQKCKPNSIPILIIDEFDKLEDEYAIKLTANVIKSLADYSVHCTIIIVGVAENLSDLIKEHASIKRSLVQVHLDRMNDRELKEIIESRLALTPLKIDRDALSKIVKLARGLPYYVHALGKFASISAADDRRLSINKYDVERAMDTFVDDMSESFYDDYDRATASNQRNNFFKEVLLACALADADERGFFAPSSIAPPLSKLLNKPVAISAFQRHLAEFISEERGEILIRRGEERKYRFRFNEPMIQPYIIIKGMRDGMVGEELKASLSSDERRL
jgi:Cdc6-like AAA superfamily ATPase